MTRIEQDLLRALVELDDAVKSLRASSLKPDIGALLARVDSLASGLPPDADGNLKHYLQRKSYEKARMWLEGRRTGIPSGVCGR
ncbi:MAG TPA: hypothetical protein PKA41_08565 [Verrucomicrobiota bacterium]|nr:hypothetical protein [Verrucomicrobiota bacterium]